MAKLNPDTHVLLDGAAKVYLRSNTKRWQATFQIEGQWIRISTGKRDLEEAKTVAELCLNLGDAIMRRRGFRCRW